MIVATIIGLAILASYLNYRLIRPVGGWSGPGSARGGMMIIDLLILVVAVVAAELLT